MKGTITSYLNGHGWHKYGYVTREDNTATG